MPAGVSGWDFLAFIIPAVSFLEITIVGQLFVTELLLLAALPWLLRSHDRQPLPRWFVVAWAGWLISQIVTDVVVGSAFKDYARGWAGILFTFTNFAAIFFLVSTPRRARFFAVGLATAGFLGFLLFPTALTALDPWKWGLAFPVGLVLVAGVSGRRAARLPWLTVSLLALFGILNLVLAYRTLGGVSLLSAGYLTLCFTIGGGHSAGKPSVFRAVLGLAFVAAAGIAILGIYSTAASQGLLGRGAQQKYLHQAGALGEILGGRPELLASSQAIIDSPVLGHGSWARDPRYAALLVEREKALGYHVTPEYVGADLIPTHSHLFGAWVWAGVLGAAFWFAVGAAAVWLLANLYSSRVEVAPLLVFSAMLLLWDIAFSPYGSSGRVTAPYALVLCLLGFRLLRDKAESRSLEMESSRA